MAAIGFIYAWHKLYPVLVFRSVHYTHTYKPLTYTYLDCLLGVKITDLNYWIKLLSCIIEANGGHIGLSHINLHWYC